LILVQVLFVHPNFPGQFGPCATRLASEPGVEVVFVSQRAEGMHAGIRCIRAVPRGGATHANHYCSRTFENAVWSAHAVHVACASSEGLAPDVIVGHSGFGTTTFLSDLYSCPVINLFEYWYRGHESDLDFRPEYPPEPLDRLRAITRNAMILLDLQAGTLGYAPTHWQRDLFPEPWRSKLRVLHDGIDTDFWRRRERSTQVCGVDLPAGRPVITYVSRGLEAMRGFDVFMRFAEQLARTRPDALFLVVGEERTHYGNDTKHISAPSFKQHVLSEVTGEVPQVHFLGKVSRDQLVEVFSVSDLHVYLTVPFVLSWSLLDAMACECAVLVSDTGPLDEVIGSSEVGERIAFGDVDAMYEAASELLDDSPRRLEMGRAARRLVEQRYATEVIYPRFRAMLDEVVER
jgi:glycosyltransferase involved in cell wall biosynthesis